MRYLSLFSGIGAFEKALRNIGINYELVGFSEIDKYAIKSYCAIHGVSEKLNLGDISKINLDGLRALGPIDLITHGSPCQDFSIAGKLAGGDKGSGTRSSLMWCTVDIVERVRPKYVIWENVRHVLSKRHRHNFDAYLQVMEDLGYNSYYEVLNAKHFGIPQNRERVFTVSIRKDIDKKTFKFPEKEELKLKLKDVLEEHTEEKYYLSDKMIASLMANSEKQKEKGNGFRWETTTGEGVAKSITTRVGACRTDDNYIKVVGKLDIKGHDCVKRVYDTDGIAPTLTDMQGGNRQPKIIIDDTQGFDGVRVYDKYSPALRASRSGLKTIDYDTKVAVAMRGRYDSDGKVEQHLEISDREIANSITTVQKDSLIAEPHLRIKEATKLGYKDAYEGDGVNISGRMKYQRGNVQKEMTQTIVTSGSERGVVVPDETSSLGLRIRKLTPRECFRLMGFSDEDFDKAKAVPTSDTQLYKQAGNSIVVNVLERIFKQLL
ncbi:MAG: DNA (cytosine-5-)-methyltransferase [Paludibacteraceae bacterium]|nr:DNA (cytosine-5-)-methyltransferase [Paludibacteraceae bacterium]